MSIEEKLVTIAENEQKVYEAGQKAEYDRFWDDFQENGNRKIYFYAFSGSAWTQETLKPKYTIRPKPVGANTQTSTGIFAYCGWQSNKPIDFSVLDIDLSNCTIGTMLFANANASKIVVDLSTFTNLSQAFLANNGGNFESINLKVSELCTSLSSAFGYNLARSIIFTDDSVIAASIDFSTVTKSLSVESLKSVINALKNFTGTDKEYTRTVKFRDEHWATLDADSTPPSGDTWKNYVYNNLCWNY
jgi:hypothetical protein